MVTVYVNGRFFSQPVSGVQRFGLELLKAVDRIFDDRPYLRNGLRFVVLSPRGAPLPGHLRHVVVRTVGVLQGHLWDQLELLNHARGGVLISLCGAGPVFHPRHVVAMHDAAVAANPRNFSAAYRTYHGALAPSLARWAKRIVTVSKFSRDEIAHHWPASADKLRIVPNGADHVLDSARCSSVLSDNGLEAGRYVLALGSVSPNKNMASAAAAVAKLDDTGIRLVVVGGRSSGVFSTCSIEPGARLTALGRVSDGAVRALYENALCFVFPSFYEGFGIPPLEAMLCGCPVIVSDIPALRETCGDAALYCDPHDPRSLEAQIRAVATDPDLRNTLRRRGLARARGFSWERSASLLLDVIREVADAEVLPSSLGRPASHRAHPGPA